MGVCMSLPIRMFICSHIHTCLYTHVSMCVCMSLPIRMFMCSHIHIRFYTHVFIGVCMLIRVPCSTHVHTSSYTHVHTCTRCHMLRVLMFICYVSSCSYVTCPHVHMLRVHMFTRHHMCMCMHAHDVICYISTCSCAYLYTTVHKHAHLFI